MTEGWGMVAAAAIAVIGGFVGLLVGRRQVRDQAQVEHGQWLRGQRQEAFVALIAAWDEVIPKFEARVLDDEERAYIDRGSDWWEVEAAAQEAMKEDRAPLRRAVERVQMLGPESVDQAVAAMLATIERMAVGMLLQYQAPPPTGQALDAFWAAREDADVRRNTFLVAARGALRQTPDTKRL